MPTERLTSTSASSQVIFSPLRPSRLNSWIFKFRCPLVVVLSDIVMYLDCGVAGVVLSAAPADAAAHDEPLPRGAAILASEVDLRIAENFVTVNRREKKPPARANKQHEVSESYHGRGLSAQCVDLHKMTRKLRGASPEKNDFDLRPTQRSGYQGWENSRRTQN